ncbi:YusW family protein [Halalkalibacter flavus]|uniref:YusW family protein n=1 Tax=Halalkalibacter flavus TaxID=3090668 RepID=UPI002FC6D73C
MKLRILTAVCAIAMIIFIGLGLGRVEASPTIIDFELEIEMKDGQEYEIEYEMKKNQIEAKYAVPRSVTVYGQEALPKIELFLKQISLVPEVDKEELMNQIFTAFKIDKKDIEEIEVDVKFDGGKRLKFEQTFS